MICGGISPYIPCAITCRQMTCAAADRAEGFLRHLEARSGASHQARDHNVSGLIVRGIRLDKLRRK